MVRHYRALALLAFWRAVKAKPHGEFAHISRLGWASRHWLSSTSCLYRITPLGEMVADRRRRLPEHIREIAA
jgi:hypothetical protein